MLMSRELKCHNDRDETIHWFKPRCICLHKEEEEELIDNSLSSTTATSTTLDNNNSNNNGKKILINEKRDLPMVEKLLPLYKFDRKYSIGESDSHACLVHDEIVYFWGGRNETEGKIHRFDLKTYCWLSPIPMNIPKKESRYYHSFIKQGNEPIFWMFGGLNNNNNSESMFYNDLICFNVNTFKWEQLEEPMDDKSFLADNEWPSKRRGHVFVYRESNHSLLLYGGCGDEVLSDLWEFNILQRKWKLLRTRNEIPPRGYSSGMIMKKDHVEMLVIYGGDVGVSNQTLTNDLCLLNLNTLEWTTLTNSITPPLFGHSGTTCKISNNEMFIYGGCNDDYIPYSESYIYNLKFNTWTQIKVDNILPLNCSSLFIDEERGFINLYGGYDHERRTDTHILIQINLLYDYTIFRNFPKLFNQQHDHNNSTIYSDVSFKFIE